MKETLKVSLVQSRLHWQDPKENRKHLAAMIRCAERSDMYIIPETFTTGFLGETEETDEGMDGPTVDWMRKLAAETGGVITGSAVIQAAQGRMNRLLFTEPGGAVHIYDKHHLFSFAGEDQRYVPGNDRVVFEYAGWRICPQICYDLRFPAWCRNRDDYDLLLFVANWPARRVEAWDTLLKARAIENQCYVAAVNRVGEDGNDVQYPGHSAIYDPFGAAVLGPDGEEAVRSADISLAWVRETRESFPFAREADSFELGA